MTPCTSELDPTRRATVHVRDHRLPAGTRQVTDVFSQHDANLRDPDGPPSGQGQEYGPTKFRVVVRITALQPLRVMIEAPEGMGQAQEIMDENRVYDLQAKKYCGDIKAEFPALRNVEYSLCLEPVE